MSKHNILIYEYQKKISSSPQSLETLSFIKFIKSNSPLSSINFTIQKIMFSLRKFVEQYGCNYEALLCIRKIIEYNMDDKEIKSFIEKILSTIPNNLYLQFILPTLYDINTNENHIRLCKLIRNLQAHDPRDDSHIEDIVNIYELYNLMLIYGNGKIQHLYKYTLQYLLDKFDVLSHNNINFKCSILYQNGAISFTNLYLSLFNFKFKLNNKNYFLTFTCPISFTDFESEIELNSYIIEKYGIEEEEEEDEERPIRFLGEEETIKSIVKELTF